MNHCRRAENIFIDQRDYQAFVDLLKETAKKQNWLSRYKKLMSREDEQGIDQIIYLTRQLRRDRLTQICAQFQMEKYSSASSIIERMKEKLSGDRKLKNRIKEIAALVLKSQEQT